MSATGLRSERLGRSRLPLCGLAVRRTTATVRLSPLMDASNQFAHRLEHSIATAGPDYGTRGGTAPVLNADCAYPAVSPLFVRAPARTIVTTSFGLEKALRIVVDSKPQCIMQLAQRESFSALP